MAHISKREFDVLDLSGQKYLEWKVDALAHLKANALENTIAENNSATSQNKAKVIIFLRHHLHESLKSEYLLVDDPKELWDNLQERYGHQQKVLLPKAQYDWINLRFQDYKSISDYNSALFRITSKLKLCGQKVTDAEMLEKTLSTMHLSNMRLQEQYRQKHFQKYSDLISVLLLAEMNNDILMRNHNMRPTGCSLLVLVHKIMVQNMNQMQPIVVLVDISNVVVVLVIIMDLAGETNRVVALTKARESKTP
ncbi:unnamed protein product, partial [Cuscuta europaea]